MDLASGPGRERRSDERGPAAGGESGRALGLRGRRPLAGRGGCGPRVGAGRSWAAEGVGFGLVPGEGKRPGEEWVWAGLGREVGCGLGFGFCFGFFPFYFYLLSHFKSKSNKG